MHSLDITPKQLSVESLPAPIALKELDLSGLTEDNKNFIPVSNNRRRKRRQDTGDSTDKTSTSPGDNNLQSKQKKKPKTGTIMEGGNSKKSESLQPPLMQHWTTN